MLRQSCLLIHRWGWVPPAATPTITPVQAEPWTDVLGLGRSQHTECGEQASTGGAGDDAGSLRDVPPRAQELGHQSSSPCVSWLRVALGC